MSGKGAGKLPTATVVVTDIIELASRVRVAQRFFQKASLKPISNTISKYYVRIGLVDEPGGLASVATIFAKEGISVSGCAQKEINREVVPVVFITHKATQGQMDIAIKKCNGLACVKEKSVVIRIEDLK